ncbi:hypothetical protein HGM15179_021014 [Zosterops borbonicus]|uniref:Uncharacterized protein n=1 Tax=Zosterops borbonicus TaxID=364589 RepID=A0A8K1D5W9_9PASS|nr:hypothetical protein HGM15179_021014 [Zosterops borbonicus]
MRPLSQLQNLKISMFQNISVKLSESVCGCVMPHNCLRWLGTKILDFERVPGLAEVESLLHKNGMQEQWCLLQWTELTILTVPGVGYGLQLVPEHPTLTQVSALALCHSLGSLWLRATRLGPRLNQPIKTLETLHTFVMIPLEKITSMSISTP